jgi:predicted RNase H-like HicB family nuclease
VQREFTVVIEKDEDGYFIGTVPQLKGCHTQARSLDELMERIKEATLLCLEAEGGDGKEELQFVGVQRIAV